MSEIIGRESVTVPAGCDADGSHPVNVEGTEVWASLDVPMAVVKVVTPNGPTMELKSHGIRWSPDPGRCTVKMERRASVSGRVFLGSRVEGSTYRCRDFKKARVRALARCCVGVRSLHLRAPGCTMTLLAHAPLAQLVRATDS